TIWLVVSRGVTVALTTNTTSTNHRPKRRSCRYVGDTGVNETPYDLVEALPRVLPSRRGHSGTPSSLPDDGRGTALTAWRRQNGARRGPRSKGYLRGRARFARAPGAQPSSPVDFVVPSCPSSTSS